MSIPNATIEQYENSIPGMFSANSAEMGVTSAKYRMRILKADVSDLEDLCLLEDILTRGIDGKDIVIMDKATHAFNESYWVIITYLEKRNAS